MINPLPTTRRSIPPLARLLLLLSLAVATGLAEDWSPFRGPNGTGVAETTGLPVEFGQGRNMRWKAALPPGHSSPVLSATRIFLTAEEDGNLLVLCLDRDTGSILWRVQAPRNRREKLDRRNNPAAATPVTDGQNVYVFFPDFGLLAYDGSGQEQWRLPLGPFENLYGMGASPILAGDSVILVCDQSRNSFLMAVDKHSGRLRWKMPRPEARSGHSTPVLRHPPGQEPEVIVPGSFLLTAYGVTTGKKVWWVRGLCWEMKSTPVLHEGVVYINGYGSPFNQPGRQVPVEPFRNARAEHDADGDGRLSREELPEGTARSWFSFTDLDRSGALDGKEWNFYRAAMASRNGMLAIRAGGSGDMSDDSLLWQYHKSVPQLPSPLLYRGVLYMINDGGIVTAMRPRSGEVLAQGRLKGAVDHYYASPVAADDKIYLVSEQGKVAVLEADGTLEVLAVNDLGEPCHATPAISQGRIYLRTGEALYCFGR